MRTEQRSAMFWAKKVYVKQWNYIDEYFKGALNQEVYNLFDFEKKKFA